MYTSEAVHSFDVKRPTQIMWDPEFGSDTANPDVVPAAGRNSASTASLSMAAVIVAAIVALVQ